MHTAQSKVTVDSFPCLSRNFATKVRWAAFVLALAGLDGCTKRSSSFDRGDAGSVRITELRPAEPLDAGPGRVGLDAGKPGKVPQLDSGVVAPVEPESVDAGTPETPTEPEVSTSDSTNAETTTAPVATAPSASQAIPIDSCSPNPCQNNGTCQPDGTCVCPAGFVGTFCEQQLNPCAADPCRNGASCINSSSGTSYVCQCLAGYGGNTCDVNLDDCAVRPCKNSGVCADRVAGFQCSCPAKFGGPTCEQAISGCKDMPCQNGGQCTDTDNMGGYRCACPAGYTGAQCEVNIDDCAPNRCQNGSACSDRVNGFVCACRPGFTGALCDINIDDCEKKPCQNGGSCRDGINQYSCSCPKGYSGTNCEINRDDCASGPCRNGASCVDGLDAYSCNCLPGFTGTQCEININDCLNNRCQNNSTCVDEINAYTCSCLPGFSGRFCETNTNDCGPPNPCENGGACVDQVSSYLCRCPAGYSGTRCETNIDECALRPCQNSGTCTDLVNDRLCVCRAGFDGVDCEININECAKQPCQHGRCTDGINAYQCACDPGYTGVNCETNIDDCFRGACLNSGKCIDGVNSYSCECPTGFSGPRCETDGRDLTPPSVVRLSPDRNATGVRKDATIRIQFSEPMAQKATVDAFQSSGLGTLSFKWLDPQTLEVTPSGLDYAEGSSTNTAAKQYTYGIGSSATDLAGNPLPEFKTSFSTLRRISETLNFERELWQKGLGFAPINARGDTQTCGPAITRAPEAYIGWLQQDNMCRVVGGYSLGSLPTGAQVESAKLTCGYASTPTKNAFSALGDLLVEQVRYNVADLVGAYAVSSAATLGSLTTQTLRISTDVASAINAELKGGRSAFQYRLRFAKDSPQSAPKEAEYVVFYSAVPGKPAEGGCETRMPITYLAP